MKAYVFPGQGAQFPAMADTLRSHGSQMEEWLSEADQILGFRISEIMTSGSEEDLRQTRVTQPAIFLHSVLRARWEGDAFQPQAVAGHSLGEFSALVAVGAISFADGLRLVSRRAEAMQKAGEERPGTMAAIVGLEDEKVDAICAQTEGVVVAANFNCPGQLVISGEIAAVELAMQACLDAGAGRAVPLAVGGAFHSPLMESARSELKLAIEETAFMQPKAKIYQNVDARPHSDPEMLKANLIAQLTAPVRWTASVQNMISDGITEFVEVGGKGNILRGLIRKIDRQALTDALV